MTSPLSEVAGTTSPHSRERMLQDQYRAFQDLVRHVWTHSAFYRDYYGSHGIREKDLTDLTVRDLPFLSKQTLMDNFDTAITDQRLRKKELEQWIQDNRDPRQSFHKDFIVIHSSGSSSNIGIFVYDQTAWHVMNTTMVTRLPLPENAPSRKTRVSFYMASHGHFGGITLAVQLPKAVYDTLIVSLMDAPEHVVGQLNSFQPQRLTGYSSSVTMLAEWAIAGKLRIRPQRIIVGAERLTQSMERRIQDAWEAPIHEFYGASESIYIAVREPGRKELTVMEDLNIVEVLDEENRPVLPGGQGRVVLTNLYNYTLPILRYELGDYVVRGTEQHNSLFTTIREIKGRVNDALPVVLDNGELDTIPNVLPSFFSAGLKEVQFISERPDHVRIDYVAEHNIDDGVRREFRRILDMKGAS